MEYPEGGVGLGRGLLEVAGGALVVGARGLKGVGGALDDSDSIAWFVGFPWGGGSAPEPTTTSDSETTTPSEPTPEATTSPWTSN